MQKGESMTSLNSDEAHFDESALYACAENPGVFRIKIVDNEVSRRCRLTGDYDLHVNAMNISMVNLHTGRVEYIWPFRFIRRYGRSKTNFQFEAGRKCNSGEGLFSLATKEGNDIFLLINDRLRQIKEQTAEKRTASISTTSPSPELPDRRYTRSDNKVSSKGATGFARELEDKLKVQQQNKPKPKPKPKPPLKPKPDKEGTIYSQPQDIQDNAWKQHAETDDHFHEEHYQPPAALHTNKTVKKKPNPVLIPQGKKTVVSSDHAQDVEYDHIRVGKGKKPPVDATYGRLQTNSGEEEDPDLMYSTGDGYHEAEVVGGIEDYYTVGADPDVYEDPEEGNYDMIQK
ncbi:docking protein 2 isoform X1 [Lingula anatina]|uniref:Docking protein 2 isoform X1 n=1 Tax=Lingula anatina TaxID=7574 RepID=A0A1S3HAX4_LINAN|nr:docking protein 2 isoform X1 [Lingula anatina]XP_013383186.1 docking protein 2 isoform X1 [Lingula anatina]XP_013383187.1 docking protein 2 isoform X2 [Lingula anatina]XP_013383188.1 docking protein 2 isoform X1 [Lingula anatina]|eukprot:XP_013383185.1 docking protein 2 isoform X1 [Lingula anatina]